VTSAAKLAVCTRNFSSGFLQPHYVHYACGLKFESNCPIVCARCPRNLRCYWLKPIAAAERWVSTNKRSAAYVGVVMRAAAAAAAVLHIDDNDFVMQRYIETHTVQHVSNLLH
jgi:hypothetical protein